MKRVLESLASSNNEKVQCDVMLLLNSCFDLHEAAVTGTSCMFLSAGTKDKRAGGDSDKVQESAGVGQRSACDHRTNTNVVYFTWYVDYCHYLNVKSKFGDFLQMFWFTAEFLFPKQFAMFLTLTQQSKWRHLCQIMALRTSKNKLFIINFMLEKHH